MQVSESSVKVFSHPLAFPDELADVCVLLLCKQHRSLVHEPAACCWLYLQEDILRPERCRIVKGQQNGIIMCLVFHVAISSSFILTTVVWSLPSESLIF